MCPVRSAARSVAQRRAVVRRRHGTAQNSAHHLEFGAVPDQQCTTERETSRPNLTTFQALRAELHPGHRQSRYEIRPGGRKVSRPKPIAWPDQAKICVTFIVPWEVWPENFATHESLQRSSHRAPPPNAVFDKNMAAVTEREYGDRVGIWRLLDLFDRHQLKVTMLMNGKKVKQFADVCREIKAKGHEFSAEGYEH